MSNAEIIRLLTLRIKIELYTSVAVSQLYCEENMAFFLSFTIKVTENFRQLTLTLPIDG